MPFFTIGVTTYNRKAMLKECLESILAQGFEDIEVIVGNDYIAEPLTLRDLDLPEDSRVRVVNHPENLGEVKNMNFLLDAAQGRYFTWLADDDCFLPGFLTKANSALVQEGFPSYIVSNFQSASVLNPREISSATSAAVLRRYSSREFLLKYLRREIQIIGCYGFFETSFLKSLGGITKLGSGFSPYSDNLLTLQASASSVILHLDEPLVFFRTHGGSLSFASPDTEAYASAQEVLLNMVEPIFANSLSAAEVRRARYLLLKWCMGDFLWVIRRGGEKTHWKSYLERTKLFRRKLGFFRFFLAAYILKLKSKKILKGMLGREERIT